MILPPAREGKTGKVGGLLRLLVVRFEVAGREPLPDNTQYGIDGRSSIIRKAFDLKFVAV